MNEDGEKSVKCFFVVFLLLLFNSAMIRGTFPIEIARKGRKKRKGSDFSSLVLLNCFLHDDTVTNVQPDKLT